MGRGKRSWRRALRTRGHAGLGAVELRPLALEDAPALARLEQLVYADEQPWPPDSFAWLLGAPSAEGGEPPRNVSLAAFDREGALVGYLVAFDDAAGDVWVVGSVTVHPRWRGRGVATGLFERFFAAVAGSERRGCLAETRQPTDEAVARLNRRMGFTAIGELERFYGEDSALAWWRPQDGQQLAEGDVAALLEAAARWAGEFPKQGSPLASSYSAD